MRRTLSLLISASSLTWSINVSADDITNTADLLNVPLEQLVNMDVTSVSKRTEKASQVAAALYVITQEDIRRSGLQSIPELLRMVPGLQVAQSGSQGWVVTSHGFASQFSNKLLVLIDGRTVYTPIFSGVFWDVQNLMLEDIERIEVIRGPGATLWGANAVNGVINIITKNAKDTQGTLLTGATGSQERVQTGARYGGKVDDISYRAYGQYFDYNPQHLLSNGNGAGDAWDNGQGGFRMDWNGSGKDTGTLQGDVYKGHENARRIYPVTSTISPSLSETVNNDYGVSGMNVLGRWKHEFNRDSDITLQAYYDDAMRQFLNPEIVGMSAVNFRAQTLDFDFQHNWTANKYNNITWGFGYRRIDTTNSNDFYLSFSPENYYENLYSGFLQDKIAIVQDKLFLTAGSKLEHNDFSGFEYEPSVRLSWLPSDNQTAWAAISRAVHTPNQADHNLNLILLARSSSPTTMEAELGQPNTVSEALTAYELGYRIQPVENFSIDITGFYNHYNDLASLVTGATSLQFDPILGSYTYLPLVRLNENNGETHGVELASTWEATKWLKFNGSWSIFASHLNIVGASLVTKSGTAPNQQFNLRSYVDLPYHVQWDTMLYHVDQLPAVPVPAYTRLDTRIGYSPIKGLDLSLIGQNLLRAEHQEFSGFFYESPEEIGRSVLAKATFRF